jgi:phosphatidylserine/phosphatidylglycerophosphate/cardiolipin synthase-like enzyme
MPMWVDKRSLEGVAVEAIGAAAVAAPLIEPAMVARQCTLAGYDKRPIPTVTVQSDVIAYASPDSTYAVTKQLFDAARKSILIGIYDFSAPHMKQLVLDAMARGVKVSLMLDINSESERALFDELVDMGALGVEAPSCANERIQVFSSSHLKVIVIDDEWTLVQSGNYSSNSIPLNERDGQAGTGFRTGNRDTGIAFRSRPLAKLFTEILRADMDLTTSAPEPVAAEAAGLESRFLVERAPTGLPSTVFPSMRFNVSGTVSVRPVLSPDNYMDVLPELLASATKSILIEQQYIRASQPSIRLLLDAIAEARGKHPALTVRIVLGKVFSARDLVKERKNLEFLSENYGLELDTHIRYVNTDRLVHCHNKMVVIDDAGVLVSSQNWSDFAVTKNREAGVWVPHDELAKYYAAIFDVDWRTAFTSPAVDADQEAITPEALGAGGFLRVERADYLEV